MISANGKGSGLENVVATRTRLSAVEGQAGELVIAGHRVEDLAARRGFEDVCRLLWDGELPTAEQTAELRRRLGRRRSEVHRVITERRIEAIKDPMDSLRSILATFESSGDLVEDAVTMLAAVPVASAWWWSAQTRSRLPEPRDGLSTAADYLRMISRQSPSTATVRGLERYLVTVSDHGMNASTFTARVIASTRSDLISAVVGAVGALKGPLHGGAPGPVLEMLDAIGTPERAEEWLRGELDGGRRIMGMGHRVYRVRDPRAAVLEHAITELVKEQATERLLLARSVERVAEAVLAERHPERALKANVEFYTAVLLEAVGVPRELFSATFALGRMAGWTAHVMEQRAEDRLIRPQSEYVGPLPA